MEVIIRCAVCRFDFLAERRTLQGAAVVPPALMHRGRPHARGVHRLLQTQPVQQTRGVRTDLNARADLAEPGRSLVHMDVETGLKQRKRRGKSADAAADYRDAQTQIGLALRRSLGNGKQAFIGCASLNTSEVGFIQRIEPRHDLRR